MKENRFKQLLQRELKKALIKEGGKLEEKDDTSSEWRATHKQRVKDLETAHDEEIKKSLNKYAEENPEMACAYAQKMGYEDLLDMECEKVTGEEEGEEEEEEEGEIDPVPLFKGKNSLYQNLLTQLIWALGIQRPEPKKQLAALVVSILKDLKDQLNFNQIPVSEEKKVAHHVGAQKGVLHIGKAAGSRLKGAFGGGVFDQKTITAVIVKILKPFIAKALEDRFIQNIQIKENYINLTIEENV